MKVTLKKGLTALMALPCALQAAQRAVATDVLTGGWRVTAVHTDRQATRRATLVSDDPRLVGRKVRFSRQAITGDLADDLTCQAPDYQTKGVVSLAALIRQTSGRRLVTPALPEPADFGFKNASRGVTWFIRCKSGVFGPPGDTIANWVSLIAPGTAVTNWYDNSYLALRRIAKDEKIRPSFACTEPLNATEKAICDNNDLAAWDNSVSAAYQAALELAADTASAGPQAGQQLQREQRAWLAERNRCLADAACLQKRMRERVDVLMTRLP